MQVVLPVFMFLSVACFSFFSFIAVAKWSDARLKEREAYYKCEALKKLAEIQGPAAIPAIELLRDEEKTAARRQRESLKLAGLVNAAAGIGVIPLLRAVAPEQPVYLAGLIPLMIGIAILIYTYVLAPKI